VIDDAHLLAFFFPGCSLSPIVELGLAAFNLLQLLAMMVIFRLKYEMSTSYNCISCARNRVSTMHTKLAIFRHVRDHAKSQYFIIDICWRRATVFV